jgi:hypothetical protein
MEILEIECLAISFLSEEVIERISSKVMGAGVRPDMML